jgi:hypothetical protein
LIHAGLVGGGQIVPDRFPATLALDLKAEAIDDTQPKLRVAAADSFVVAMTLSVRDAGVQGDL